MYDDVDKVTVDDSRTDADEFPGDVFCSDVSNDCDDVNDGTVGVPLSSGDAVAFLIE